MFTTSTRYITSGIAHSIKAEIQQVLWHILDEDLQQQLELDYLQIFKICGTRIHGKPALRITHRQEQPHREKVYLVLNMTSSDALTVWIIDSGTYSTMLLPNEY